MADGRNETPPKEIVRRRALSISDSDKRTNKVAESTSIFFKLPLEIREKIYAEIVGTDRIWIVFKTQKLTGLREVPAAGLHILPFLQSCWWIYCEAINFLYSTPTFAFKETQTFLAFCASILPARMKQLRSITIDLSEDPAQQISEDSSDAIIQETPNHVLKASPGTSHQRPHLQRLDYDFFDSYRGTLYNASILYQPDQRSLYPYFMWNAMAVALRKMKELQELLISLRDVSRRIDVWIERGYEHSGQVDARDVKASLESVGRDTTWEEEGRKKRKDTNIVFENTWHQAGELVRGHWVRGIDDDGEVNWQEVGRAAEPYVFDPELMYYMSQ